MGSEGEPRVALLILDRQGNVDYRTPMVRWFGNWSIALPMMATIAGCTSTSAVHGNEGGEGASDAGGGGQSGGAGHGGTAGGTGDDVGSIEGGADGEGGAPVGAVCVAGHPACLAQRVVVCNADGTGYEDEGTDCSPTQTCVAGACEDHECAPDARFCSGSTVRQCAADGLSSEDVDTCENGEYCAPETATCKVGVCAASSAACDGNIATECDAAGSAFLPGGTDCGATATCDAGTCRPHLCAPDQTFCQGQQVKQCASNGLGSTVIATCTNQTCVISGGTATCTGVCVSGQTRCSGTEVQSCTDQGQWGSAQACSFVCAAGACAGECKPGDRRCASDSGVPQLCDASGVWRNQTACGADRTCTAGDCLCLSGLTDCSGACAVLSTSEAHCGRCGHSCLGGGCENGTCRPFEVTAGLTAASYLALSSTHVYWMDSASKSGSLRRVPKNGGAVETLHAGNDVGHPGGVDVQGNQLYWGTRSANGLGVVAPRFYRASLDGASRVEFAPVQGDMQGVQVAGDVAYWAEYRGTSFDFIRKALTGTAAPEPWVSGISSGGGFAWAGNCLYYTPGDNSLYRKCDGNPIGVFSGSVSLSQHSPSDASMIYFGAKGQGLMRLSLTASQAASVVTAGTDVREPLVDGNFIYFIDGDTGGAPACTTNWSIERSGKTPGSTSTILVPPPLDCPGYLVDDANAVYWMETTVIRKIAKP